MAKKYILDPSGSIIEYTTGSRSELQNKPLYENISQVNNNSPESTIAELGSIDGIEIVNASVNTSYQNKRADYFMQEALSFEGKEGESNITSPELKDLLNSGEDFLANDIFLEIEKNKSFDFKNESTTGTLSYKPFTYIGDASEIDMASEFEILTGVNISAGFTASPEVFRTSLMVLEYFVKIIARWGVMEALVVLNKVATNIPSGTNNKIESFHLTIGRYDFTTFDIFSNYVFDVLNYPYKNSTLIERITAYFIGFTAWCAPNSVLNLDQIVRNGSDNEFKNFLDASLISKEKHILLFGTELPSMLLVMASSSIELILDSLANSQHVKNRVKLLTRKFKQEAHWKNNIVYKSKLENLNFTNNSMNSFDKFMSDLNYYYIKFYIERVQIGLKILKKYYNEETYQNKKNNKSFVGKDLDVISKENSADKNLTKYEKGNQSEGLDDSRLHFNSFKYFWRKDLAKSKNNESLNSLPQLFKFGSSLASDISAFGGKLSIQDSIRQNFATKSTKASFAEKSDRIRLPKELVETIENYLESEYMPFYFHDVRTNEIISFHAFIESISDSFNPEYNSASGFGRIDDVRSYIKTTRNINLSFTVAAMNPDDHDLMWYQINKIVAMVYPQWSDGFPARPVGGSQPFKYPFSQVPTASPLIRLRVGDVIKNNYSRLNLLRLHGDDPTFPEKAFYDNITNKNNDTNKNKEECYLKPGLYKLADRTGGFDLGVFDYNFETLSKTYNVNTETKITKIVSESKNTLVVEIPNYFKPETETDTKDLFKTDAGDNFIQLVVDSMAVIKTRAFFDAVDNNNTARTGLVSFKNNPLTSSYESGMSRGLAGFITQLDVNYNEVNWDVTRIGSKAPMMVKITVNFAPIHDIPPGLDHNGMLRAPVYNVGRVNNQMFGDSQGPANSGGDRDSGYNISTGFGNATKASAIKKFMNETS